MGSAFVSWALSGEVRAQREELARPRWLQTRCLAQRPALRAGQPGFILPTAQDGTVRAIIAHF